MRNPSNPSSGRVSPWLVTCAALALVVAAVVVFATQAGRDDTAYDDKTASGGTYAAGQKDARHDPLHSDRDTRDLPVSRPAPPATMVLPAGTAMTVRLESTVSTETSHVGDAFKAALNSPVSLNGRMLLPAGARITGHVVRVEQPPRAGGRARLQLAYDRIAFNGRSYDLATTGRLYVGQSSGKRDAAMIGDGAVAGGIVGGILGDGVGDAAKGAIIGGTAGGVVSLVTRGPHLVFQPGTLLDVRLDRSLQIPVSAV
jgi:hypothetical protein